MVAQKPSPRQGPGRLYKSSQNRVIDGVCGGLGEYFAVDPTLIRIGWVILALLWGSGIVAYVVATIVMPRRSEEKAEERAWEEGGPNPRIWWGVLLMLAGLVLLINIYIPRPYHLWFWWRPLGSLWPLFLVVIGLWILGSQLRKSAAGQDQKPTSERVGKTLYRSASERMLAGVCGGLAEFLGIDPSIVRILWVLATLASVGLGVLVYLAMWILVPEGPEEEKAL